MLEELEQLISFIQKKYELINCEWEKSELYSHMNMKKKLVKDIYSDNDILSTIFNYRTFINDKNLRLSFEFQKIDDKNTINTRVKAQNSIEYKINNYINNHNFGKIPINKCFNDLFGIRIIFNNEIEYYKIKEFVENKYLDLKCIDSSKEDYVATHIYFKKDNFCFQWELQIWDKLHEKNNIISHERYKQEYTKWEQENKGGEPS